MEESKPIYRRNLVIALLSLFGVFILLIILGFILQKNGYDAGIITILMIFIVLPGFFFIIAYYGIRRKTGFPEYAPLVLIVASTLIFRSAGWEVLLIVFGILFFTLFGIKKIMKHPKIKVKGQQLTLAQEELLYKYKCYDMGIISFILGILLLLFFVIITFIRPWDR